MRDLTLEELTDRYGRDRVERLDQLAAGLNDDIAAWIDAFNAEPDIDEPAAQRLNQRFGVILQDSNDLVTLAEELAEATERDDLQIHPAIHAACASMIARNGLLDTLDAAGVVAAWGVELPAPTGPSIAGRLGILRQAFRDLLVPWYTTYTATVPPTAGHTGTDWMTYPTARALLEAVRDREHPFYGTDTPPPYVLDPAAHLLNVREGQDPGEPRAAMPMSYQQLADDLLLLIPE